MLGWKRAYGNERACPMHSFRPILCRDTKLSHSLGSGTAKCDRYEGSICRLVVGRAVELRKDRDDSNADH